MEARKDVNIFIAIVLVICIALMGCGFMYGVSKMIYYENAQMAKARILHFIGEAQIELDVIPAIESELYAAGIDTSYKFLPSRISENVIRWELVN